MKAMPIELFQRLVDQAVELDIPYLCPNGYGEICTMPVGQLEQYLEYLRSRSKQIKVLINTNGNRMFEDRASLFIEHEVHLINVTIDGATATTAESIRLNLNFSQIESNIKNLIAMRNAAGKKYPRVRVGMVAMQQTLPEIEMFYARWKGIADYIGIGGFSSRLASVSTGEMVPSHKDLHVKHHISKCVLPFRDLNIWADGHAVLCCEDWNEEHIVGDLNTQTIAEIWHGPALTEVRRKHVASQGGDLALCAKCNNWQQPSLGSRLWY